MNTLDKCYIAALCRMQKVKESVKEFYDNQSGVSNIVATIMILLIVLLLIGLLWPKLKTWVETLMGKAFDESKIPQ